MSDTNPSPPGPRILYLSEWRGQSGGIKVLYDHVAALRTLGYEALLAARGEFPRCEWFDDHTVEATPSFDLLADGLRPTDVLVVPEIAIGHEDLKSINCRKIGIVQNPKFLGGPMLDADFEAAIVPSHPLIDWLREASPFTGPIRVCPSFIEDRWFGPQREPFKGPPRVLLTARDGKHQGEPFFAAGALAYAGLQPTLITDGCSREEFIQNFRAHDIYMHLSYPEGLPMPPFECFANDCLLVGFAGIGGLEYMEHGKNALVFPDGDWLPAVNAVMAWKDGADERVAPMLAAGRATARHFNWEHMRARLAEAFGELVGPPPTPAR